MYAIGAALTQGRILTALPEDGSELERPDDAKGGAAAQFLALVVQINVGLFISSMIFLLRETGVYWNQAWAFFLPLAVVAYGLSLVHRPLAAARGAYQLAAAAGLAFGIMALASPAWLPVLLAAQAIGMLRLAERERSLTWGSLSALLVLYSGLEILTEGKISIFGMGPTTRVEVEWWTSMAAVALLLAYAGLASIRLKPLAFLRGLDQSACVFAAIVHTVGMARYVKPESEAVAGILWAGPMVAAAAIALRLPVLLTFTFTLSVFGMIVMGLLSVFSRSHNTSLNLGVFIASGIAAGIALERMGSGRPKADRRCAGVLYIAVHIATALLLSKLLPREWFVPAQIAAAFVALAIAVVSGSRLLFWSALLPVLFATLAFFMVAAGSGRFNGNPGTVLLAGLLLAALAAVFGTRSVGIRVSEDVGSRRQPAAELVLMFVAGAMVSVWGSLAFGATWFVVVAGIGAALAAAAVVTGRPMLIGVGFFYLAAGGVLLIIQSVQTRSPAEGLRVAMAAAVTVALIVAGERVLAFRAKLRRSAVVPGEADLMSDETADTLRQVLAVGGLAAALFSVYTHPSVRSFYLSAAIVGAGFLWIVLGLLFRSGVYRKAGFAVVCFAIAKALGFDTRALSKELQIVSLGVLGGILLAAGWLYSRYRTRLLGSGEPETEADDGSELPPSDPVAPL